MRWLIILAILLAACGDDSTATDSGVDGGVDSSFDAAFDAAIDTMGVDAPGVDTGCPAGFDRVGDECVDIDECTTGTHDCDALTTCVNEDGSFSCTACPAGYDDVGGGGRMCVDLDECEADPAVCAAIACTNEEGSFTCACPAGWSDPSGDASVCLDENECLGEGAGAGCAADATCTNSLGGFACTCRPGYSGDGTTCSFVGAPGGFEGGPVLGVDDFAQAIDGGDLNGDGVMDVVAITARPPDAQVILSDGAGGYDDPVHYTVGGEPYDVRMVDFDGDGNLDVLATNFNGNGMRFLRGDGTGVLTPAGSAGGDNTRAIVVDHFDGDTNLDVAFVSWGDDSIKVVLGDGTATLPSATSYPAIDGPNGLCAGDFDGDGDLDLAMSNGTLSTDQVSVMLGDGSGGFGAATRWATIGDPQQVACGDFDDDGNDDIALETRDDVRILFGDGAGGLAMQVTLTAGPSPTDVFTGDMNLDGRDDLIATTSGLVQVYLNNGTRTPAAPIDTVAGRTDRMAIVDLDGNAAPDLALALNSGLVGLDPLAVLPGAGDGGFLGPVSISTLRGAFHLDDIDGDGHLDIASRDDTSFVTIRGDGSGAFAAWTTTTVESDSGSLVGADFNEDGELDFALTNSGAGTFSILLASAGGYDVGATLPSGGERPLAIEAGDFDEDGHVDLAIINQNERNVVVHFGDGAGGFESPVTMDIPSTARHLVVADLDGDRHLDLLIGHSNITGRLTFQYGDGLGGFTMGTERTVPSGVSGLVVADVNDDDQPDIVILQRELSVLLSSGGRDYAARIDSPTHTRNTSMVVGDFDEDRNLDVVIGLSTLNGICLQSGDGTGAFGAPADCVGLGTTSFLKAGDVDEDSHLDVVAGGSAVWFN